MAGRRHRRVLEVNGAVREQDLLTISTLCAQLFDLNSVVRFHPSPTAAAS